MIDRSSIFLQVGDVTCVIWKETLNLILFIGEVSSACIDAVRQPKKIRWRETLFYMNMCGSDGLPITALICLLTGIILGYQCAVQMHKYGADAFLPGLVGCSVVRELGPMMVAIVATGRAGSAFAAEIGTMKVSEEIDAMRTMGFIPERFLVIPKLIAMMLMIPMLTTIGDIMGIVGGMIVGNSALGMPLPIISRPSNGSSRNTSSRASSKASFSQSSSPSPDAGADSGPAMIPSQSAGQPRQRS